MYFLFELNPSLSISVFIDLLISKKIRIKSKKSKNMFRINKYCKFCSFNSMGLLSINVKNVKKPTKSVIKKIKIINRFFFKNSCINKRYYSYKK